MCACLLVHGEWTMVHFYNQFTMNIDSDAFFGDQAFKLLLIITVMWQ